MQNNNFLSRDKTQALIDGIGVKEADGEAFLKGLADKGYTIEGYNDQPKEPTLGRNIMQRGRNIVSTVKETVREGKDIAQDESLTPTQKMVGITAKTAQAPLRVLGQAGGAIGDVIGAAAAPVIEAATPIVKKGYNAVSDLFANPTSTGGVQVAQEPGAIESTVAKAISAWDKYSKENPEVAQSLSDIGNLFNLVGAGTAGKATGQVALKVLPKGAKAINATSNALKEGGSRVYSSAFTPNTVEAERILAYEATKPSIVSKTIGAGALEGNPAFKPLLRSDTALRTGIVGTEKQIGVQARQVADTLYRNEIKPAVEALKGVITKDELFAPLVKRVSEVVDPTKKKAYEQALESLVEDYANVTQYTYKQAQKLKSELAEFTPTKIFKGQDVANELRMLQADMASGIREKTYEALKDINVKQKYLDYGNLKELQKVGVKAISEGGLKGGFGGFWSTLYDTAMAPIKTIGGKTIYKIGDKLQVTAPKGYEGKPLRTYLEAVGYLSPGSITKEEN